MTSTLFIIQNEDEIIDSAGVGLSFESPHVTQVDNPDEFPVDHGQARGSALPSPSVGGKPSSGKDRIGHSDGFFGIRLRRIPFTGKIWTAPPVTAEPIQGRVGQGTHANQLQAGVRQQMTQYDGSLAANARTFVGSVSD